MLKRTGCFFLVLLFVLSECSKLSAGDSKPFAEDSKPPTKERKIAVSPEDIKINMLLDDFEKLVDIHANIMEQVRGGNVYLLMGGTTILEQLRTVLSSLQPNVEKMSPRQRQRFEAAAAKFEKNRLMQ
jgi:hypothetical protein